MKKFIQSTLEILCLIASITAGVIFLVKEDLFHFEMFVFFSLILITTKIDSLKDKQ